MSRAFPYLNENERFQFPPVEEATEEGIVGVGGNLSPGMLLSAYSQGIFPWYSPGEPILWWSPDPRFVLFPDRLHISHSMRKLLNQRKFEISIDRQFEAVISECRDTSRPGQNGTWITEDIVDGYVELHRIGAAHSVEVSRDGNLVGGLYGVCLGSCFFGESMFARESNASKAGFISLVRALVPQGLTFIDCQVPTDHLASLGAEEIPRDRFYSILRDALKQPGPGKDWSQYLNALPPMNSRRID